MDKKQNATVNMFRTTSNCLTGHNTQVATVPALQSAATKLKDNIEDIDEQAGIQDVSDEGVADDKEVVMKALCTKAATLAAQARPWAILTNNTIMAARLKVTYSQLINMPDGLLAEKCQGIHDDIDANKVALVPYGITQTKIDALKDLIDAYSPKSTAPRDAETVVMTATETLEELIKSTRTLCKDVIDGLMNEFKETDLQFYKQYKAARKKVDAATSSTQFKGTVTNAADDTPLAGAIVSTTANGNPVAAITNALGKYKLLVPPGTYTLTIALNGFVTKTITNVTVQKGEAVETNVEMEAV